MGAGTALRVTIGTLNVLMVTFRTHCPFAYGLRGLGSRGGVGSWS